jgi:hypothetical protein
MHGAPDAAAPSLPDLPTLIGVSALAYVLATALHEHFGHAAACLALGSHPTELGAFYVECDDARLSAFAVRLVALAGPFVSLLTGLVCFGALRRLPHLAGAGFYFVWLLGAIGLMQAAGYLMFSGLSGQGDLGTTRDGALYGASPEWLWRGASLALGVLAYVRVMRSAVRAIAPRVNGSGAPRVRVARLTALASYLTGAAVSVTIGLFSPKGFIIVLLSAMAASLGGTAGLLFMMQWLNRQPPVQGPGLYFARSWGWIAAGAAATLFYAAIFGPTLRP